MNANGIVRRVDDLGRIVLPKDIRKPLKIKFNTPLEMVVVGGLIILGKIDEGEGDAE
jgi:transcriptional pleiotropic regulator of transition state genes